MQGELTVCVEHPELPAIRWNEAEVQQNLTEMLAAYTGRVYTPESIKDAKADRAAVNKLDKQLADAARGAKTFYMKPLEEFLQRTKQMQAQCKQVSGAIDQQVKAVEEAERQDKADALQAVYTDCIGELRELSLNSALAEHTRRQSARDAQRRAEAERLAAERARAAAPVILPPSEEERQIKAEAAAEAQSNAFITASGRLDCEVLQHFAEPAAAPQPARKRYSFWVEFTPEDIAWFKQGAAERGFRFGSIK